MQPNAVIRPQLFIAILLFATLPHIATDIYVPSMPAITKALGANRTTIQLTLAVFMFGYSISHLFYGPISDRIGRRQPMLFGISLSAIGTLFCLLAPSVYILILGRFIQGIGVHPVIQLDVR